MRYTAYIEYVLKVKSSVTAAISYLVFTFIRPNTRVKWAIEIHWSVKICTWLCIICDSIQMAMDIFPYRFLEDIGLVDILSYIDHRSSSYHFVFFHLVISSHIISYRLSHTLVDFVMHIHKSSIICLFFHNYRLPYFFHITIIVYFSSLGCRSAVLFALTVILASSVSICVFPYVFSLPN